MKWYMNLKAFRMIDIKCFMLNNLQKDIKSELFFKQNKNSLKICEKTNSDYNKRVFYFSHNTFK